MNRIVELNKKEVFIVSGGRKGFGKNIDIYPVLIVVATAIATYMAYEYIDCVVQWVKVEVSKVLESVSEKINEM